MSGAVTFDVTAWKLRYPEFATVNDGLAQLYFNEATLYCRNELNPVPTVEALSMLLNMLTAHIAALNSPTTASGSSPGTPPGRIGQASEGSVSVTYNYEASPGSEQWFIQTKYGAAYWQASLSYRLFRYKPKGYGPASLAQQPWLYPNTGS